MPIMRNNFHLINKLLNNSDHAILKQIIIRNNVIIIEKIAIDIVSNSNVSHKCRQKTRLFSVFFQITSKSFMTCNEK